MVRTVSATDARVRFGKLLRDVADGGETFVVERSGKPEAVVLPVEEFERLQSLRPQDDRWRGLLHRTWELIDREVGDRELTPADEIVRQGREERDARILGLS